MQTSMLNQSSVKVSSHKLYKAFPNFIIKRNAEKKIAIIC